MVPQLPPAEGAGTRRSARRSSPLPSRPAPSAAAVIVPFPSCAPCPVSSLPVSPSPTCEDSKADDLLPTRWSHSPPLQSPEGSGEQRLWWRMGHPGPTGQLEPLEDLLLGQLEDQSSLCVGCQRGAPTGGTCRPCHLCPHQCPQQPQLELDTGESHGPGERPGVRSGPRRAGAPPVGSGRVEANEEGTAAAASSATPTLGQG